MTIITIIIKRKIAGLRPGDLMEVMVPGRGRMRVPIPDGVAPGQVFRFRVPN